VAPARFLVRPAVAARARLARATGRERAEVPALEAPEQMALAVAQPVVLVVPEQMALAVVQPVALAVPE